MNLRLCNLCEALKISRKEGENADRRNAPCGGVALKISAFSFVSSKEKVRTKISTCVSANHALRNKPPICRDERPLAEKVNATFAKIGEPNK